MAGSARILRARALCYVVPWEFLHSCGWNSGSAACLWRRGLPRL